MTFAHWGGGTADRIGYPPRKWYDGRNWHDLRPLDPDELALAGWYTYVAVAQPADTATDTFDHAYVLDAAAHTVTDTWTQRPKTPEEVAAATEEANAQTIRDAVSTALTGLQTIQADLDTLAGTDPATINANPAGYIKALGARVKTVTVDVDHVIRFLFKHLDELT